MSRKRSAEDQEASTPRLRRDSSKRTKLSPSADRSNSSEPSTCSVSEDSALRSSPPASARDRISSMSSLQSDDTTSDSGSSFSSDSDSDLSASDSEEEIVTIGGPKKPSIQPMNNADGHEDLRARIAAFLPQMKEANSLLASATGQYSMEDVEDGEQHIEMNLGLGVLEEQREDEHSSSDSSDEGSEDERVAGDEVNPTVYSGATKRSHHSGETKYMDKLAGRVSEEQRSGIQEIG